MAPTRTILRNKKPGQLTLKVLGLNICRVQWSSEYVPSHMAGSILEEPSHVHYLPTVERYRNRAREGIWWTVTSNTLTGMRCMRSHGSRRLRIAMTEALLAKGYDKQGRLLVSSSAGKDRVELRGSVQIHILQACIDAKWNEVQKQTGLMLDKIVDLCRTTSGNSRVVFDSSRRWTAAQVSQL